MMACSRETRGSEITRSFSVFRPMQNGAFCNVILRSSPPCIKTMSGFAPPRASEPVSPIPVAILASAKNRSANAVYPSMSKDYPCNGPIATKTTDWGQLLRAILSVNVNVFVGQVAGEEGQGLLSPAQVNGDLKTGLLQVFVGYGFVERRLHTFLADLNGPEENVDLARIEFDAATADRSQDPPPVGVSASPCGLDQRGVRDGAGDLIGFPLGLRALNLQTNHVLNAFAISNDLLGKRSANLFQSLGEFVGNFRFPEIEIRLAAGQQAGGVVR